MRIEADRQPPDIDNMETVNLLVGVDGVDHGIGIDLFRQRQLHQNTVDTVITVELLDKRDQLFLACASIEPVFDGFHPGGFSGLDLVADIDLAGRILTDQNNRQPGLRMALRHEIRSLPPRSCR